MTNKVKRLIIPAAAALLLLSALALILYFDKIGALPDMHFVLDVPLKDIQSVSVENDAGKYILEGDGSGVFQVVGLKSLPIDTYRVQIAVKSVAQLSDKPVDTGISMDKLGLSPMRSIVTISLKGRKIKLNVGNLTKDGVYVELDGMVYLADKALFEMANAVLESYVDTQLTPKLEDGELTKINLISISGTDRSENIMVEKIEPANEMTAIEDAVYAVTQPTSCDVSLEILEENMLRPIGGLYASGVVTTEVSDAFLKRCGLDQPTHVLQYEIEKEPVILYFGDITRDAQFYVMREGIDVIYTVPVSSVLFLQTRLPDIVKRVVISRPIDSFNTLSIESGQRSYYFEASGSGENLKIKSGEAELDTEGFRKFYAVFLGIMLEGEAEKPVNVQPAVTVRIGYRNSDKVDLVEYIPTEPGSRRYFVSINGSGIFYVMNKDVTAMLEAAEKLVNGDTVAIS